MKFASTIFITTKITLLIVTVCACKLHRSDVEIKEQYIVSNEGLEADISFKPAVYQMPEYLPKIKNKRIALVVNQTSTLNGVHLLDTLLALGVNVTCLLAPAHGLTGEADAGEYIQDQIDAKTGIKIFSLYGKNKKPSPQMLDGVDIVLFDIQDVGARFYTYISTLHYVMEASAEADVEVMVLDRPNPNGFYVDGPVLDSAYSSFVGMHSVPVVHGMTMGEYALMINGEQWLHAGLRARVAVVAMNNYSHKYRYKLPIAPSPNLQTERAVLLYPSLCFFEGTDVSVGRGTAKPFEWIGKPNFIAGDFTFIPKPIKGVSNDPLHNGKTCRGYNLSTIEVDSLYGLGQIQLGYLINFYKNATNKATFFNAFFDKLAGNSTLRKQIIAGQSEDKIRQSWTKDLDAFKLLRNKYLLYQD